MFMAVFGRCNSVCKSVCVMYVSDVRLYVCACACVFVSCGCVWACMYEYIYIHVCYGDGDRGPS